MERLMKVMCLVVGVTLCSSVALAGENVFYPTGSHTADWNLISNWVEVSTGWAGTEPATALPSLTSGVYVHATSPSLPMDILAGNTGNADYIYFGTGGAGDEADILDVHGTLDMIDGVGYDGLFFGGFTADVAQPSVLTVYDGGLVNAGYVATYGLSATEVDNIVIEGGTANIGYILSAAYDAYFSKLAIQVNGGTLNLPSGNYQGSGWGYGATSATLTIDIAGGILVIEENSFNADVAGGVIMANGIAVDAGNLNSLLDVSGVGSGVITAQLIPEPATLMLLGLGAVAAFRRKR